ncbi:SEC-C metal-binding domain-containing protein [Xanthomonas campestris pv. campestris]|uniref:SEC-C metal-binding domain-containing protein n=1 Tax=Xanthomonas campestris TaxID=339 RepID=UPI003A79E5C8
MRSGGCCQPEPLRCKPFRVILVSPGLLREDSPRLTGESVDSETSVLLPMMRMWCQNGAMNESAKALRERLNLRLPSDLKTQLQQYSDSLGVPLNTAAILLLRTYLPVALGNGMQSPRIAAVPKSPKPPSAKPSPPSSPPPAVSRLLATPPGTPRPRVGRNDPCPCRSGKKAKQCHPEWT